MGALIPSRGSSASLTALRAELARLARTSAAPPPTPLPFGVGAIDAALPAGGLARAALHAIEAVDDGAAAGFATALLARFAGPARPVAWIGPLPDLYAPGLAALGLDPARLIIVAARGREAQWAFEEALRARVFAAVLAELETSAPIAGRRLQLAAEAGGTAALLLRRPGGRMVQAARTRWRIAAHPSAGDPGLGAPRWRVELLAARGGSDGAWTVEWRDGQWHEHAADRLALPAASGERSARAANG
jgi:protein ImuA